MTSNEQTNRKARALVRRIARCRNNTQSIVLVPDSEGLGSVGFVGDSYHYQTRGGQRIHHPGAYSRRGWGNMVYVSSTRRLECGAEFFAFLRRWVAN